jgi:hypothetical protein
LVQPPREVMSNRGGNLVLVRHRVHVRSGVGASGRVDAAAADA